ncbi:MAG: glycosyltransferase family 4 protein [Arcanobacterium sp.]|nr:glycosyltransferase family 4 protein [Arcanobacterium sp.]
MHIMIITQQWAPEFGIPQLRGAWFVQSLMTAGHTVDVITAPPHYPTGKLLSDDPAVQAGAVAIGENGERVWRSHFRPHTASIPSRMVDQLVVALSSIRAALKARAVHQPDVILASAPPLPSAFTAWTVARILHVPFIVDVRDAWPDLSRYVAIADSVLLGKTTLRGTIRQPAINLGAQIFDRMLRSANGLITTNERHTCELQRRYRKPVITISNIELENASAAAEPVSTGAVSPTSVTSPNPSKPLTRPLRVLYAGTVGRAQGIENLVRAAAIAQHAGHPIELTVAGNGAHLKVAKAVAKKLGVPVEFLGRVDPSTVRERYRWADVVMVHLRPWEPLQFTIPSKTFEVISTGKYVVGVVQGAAAELIEHAGAGSVVPPGDPQALAAEFQRLANTPEELTKNACGAEWVRSEKAAQHSAQRLITFFDRLTHS